ncbi:MAG: hypothetical protein ACKVTZ_18135 [Bacteroidia bacterium]
MTNRVFFLVLLSFFLVNNVLAQYDRISGERGPSGTYAATTAAASTKQSNKTSEIKEVQNALLKSIAWSHKCKPSTAVKVGDEVVFIFSAVLKEGVALSSTTQPQKSLVPTTFELGANSKGIELVGDLVELNPENRRTQKHPVLQMEMNCFTNSVVFIQRAKVTELNPVVNGTVSYQIFNSKMGVPDKEMINFDFSSLSNR